MELTVRNSTYVCDTSKCPVGNTHIRAYVLYVCNTKLSALVDHVCTYVRSIGITELLYCVYVYVRTYIHRSVL